MKKIKVIVLVFSLLISNPSKADIWGGDVAVLAQILVNAIQQLAQLKQIMTSGKDSLGLMREINRGIRDGLNVINIINPRFNPGLYGKTENAEQVLQMINDLYGNIPQTAEYRLQEAQDRSVAESIAMNGNLFRYADQVDDETQRILAHSRVVSPQGAAKLTAQSLGVLIGVTAQVLRTNSMMLKIMGENMALNNRQEKIKSAQFKNQYEGLSSSLSKLPAKNQLNVLK